LNLQQFVEAQLVLYLHCDVIHLTLDALQDLVIGEKFLANICIDSYLIRNNILERQFISIEFLPVTTLLVVVKGEVGLIPSRVEALI
jgi:hypothetical protein